MREPKRRVLVLGASGMLGNAILRLLAKSEGLAAWGTVRSEAAARLLPEQVQGQVISGVDVENFDSLIAVFETARPNVVINCVGLVKQLAESEDPLKAILVNSLLPHRLARLCTVTGARLIHISTDCVFAGTKGMYRETDPADAQDLYGRSKHLGEVDTPSAITLRTSIIGHELRGAHGVVEWFLSQRTLVRGYANAIFSGLPTVELARVVRDYVVPRDDLRGVYHLSAQPISKYDLLCLVAREYEFAIDITRDDQVIIDRSLDSSRFREATGYRPAPWSELIRAMREFG